MNGLERILNYAESGIRQFPEGGLRAVLIVVLGFTFLWSGAAKTRAPWQTAYALVDFRLLRHPNIAAAWGLVSCELTLGLALIVAPGVSSAFSVLVTSIAACMFVAFSVIIASALRANRKFACACFGSEEQDLSKKSLLRSGAFGSVALICAAAGPPGTPLTPLELSLTWCTAAAVLGVGVSISSSRKLIQLPRPSDGGRA